ncbi:MAG: hypothetical protein H7176_10890 [Bdellovibrionales bacterium]|nr:hypothetical protein [Massilia sp.]
MSRNKLQLVCDNVVADPLGGYKVVESLHSGVFELASDYGEIAARIHPLKQQLFDAIVKGEEVEAQVDGVNVAVNRDVELHVNHPRRALAHVLYAHVAGKLPVGVRGQLAVRGFDEGADPVIRQMRDGSYRVVFCTMPPRRHALDAAFDVDAFGDALLNGVKAEVVWDDQDVIHVPAATQDEIRELYQFLLNYGKGA